MRRLCLCLLATVPAVVVAAEPLRVVRERIEWLDVWVPGNDTPDRPRVLLVGDSITRGYYKGVEELLAKEAVVCRLATSKSLGDPALLDEVRLVLGQARFDVVHLNNGMHGWGYTEEEYARALPDLLAAVRKAAPNARVVFAATTPVRVADKLAEVDPKTDRVRVRNKAVIELAAREKLPVNDLFAVLESRPEHFSRDGVHLTAAGSAALAEAVAAAVRKELAAAGK